MRTLPQNTPFFTETNVGIGNFNVGAQLANLRGLNPFFGTRTLTLIDTRRVVPTTEGGAVDLTLIPSMLVERTEVVTGGASAQYGSDAIAGVVNVILDKDLEGFKAQIDYGQTAEGDGGDTHASFAWGTAFGDDGRGHVIAGLEYQQQDTHRTLLVHARLVRRRVGHRQQRAFATVARAAEFRDRAEREADDVAVRRHPELPDRAVRRSAAGAATARAQPHVQCRRLGGLAVQSGCSGHRLRDAHRRRRHAARVRHVERPPRGRALLGDGACELRRQRPAQLVRRSRLLDAATRWARRRTAGSVPTGLRIQPDNAFLTPAVPAALGPNGGQLARIFMPDVINAREHDRERDDAIRDRARGRARQRVELGRLLPARQEREPSAADP